MNRGIKYFTMSFLMFLLIAAQTAFCDSNSLDVFVGQTNVLRFKGVTRIAIGNPEIADVSTFPEKPDEVLIIAIKPGITTLTVWDETGDRTHEYQVRVSNVASELEHSLYTFKYYTLTRTVYNDKISEIDVKPDENNMANLQAMLTPILGADKYSIDINRNRVFMKGARKDIEAANTTLDEIDKPLRQVLIEAKVIEITKDDLAKLGNYLLAQKDKAVITSDLSGSTPVFSATLDTFSDLARRFKITIDTLRSASVGRTLVNPKISVLDGKTAWIVAGEKLPVASRDSEKGLVSYQYVNTGIILAVTPRVGYDNSVTLWLKPEVSNISGWVGDPNSSSDNAAPIINTRELMSEIRVMDGESIVIGGLQKSENIVTKDKVPMLGDMPLVGNLFRKKTESAKTTELIISITPHIIVNNETAEPEKLGYIDLSNQSEQTIPAAEREIQK